MKANKAKLKAILQRTAKEAIAKQSKTVVHKNTRQSNGDPVIEVKDPYVSITKYLRGTVLGVWKDADVEKRLFEKALGQNDGTRGGVFVPSVLSSETIELLKDRAVVRNMPGVRTIPVSGTDKVKFNSVTNAPVISWGSENVAISEDETLAFGQDTLETHKAVCLYKMSRELLMNANVNMDALVRQELADALALEEDAVFLEGTGGIKPLGIYYNPRVVSTTLSSTITVDDLKDARYQVRILQSEINGWIMHPRTVNDLVQKKDAEGRYIFGTGPGEADLTSLLGLPLSQTTQVAITLKPSSDESYLIGANWADFVIGDGEGMRIDTSTEAHTAFEADQVWIKLVRFVGSNLRHPESFVVVKGIQAG